MTGLRTAHTVADALALPTPAPQNDPSTQRGFSLIELAVGLGATAVVGLLLWGIVPRHMQNKQQSEQAAALAAVEPAVIGFAQRQHRLPCPAADDQGREQCGLTRGRLPWRDLGLDVSLSTLQYGVGSTTLAQAATGFVPNLPPAPTGMSLTGYNPITLSNGLDLCHSLRQLTATGAGATIAGVPYAWAIAHPGANGQFDGDNGSAFDLPGKAQSAIPVYDDAVFALSPAELGARLGCPARLAAAHTAARSAYTSYDLWRATDAFAQFRSFAHQIRQTNVTYAGVTLGLAVVDVANAIGTGITAFAQTLAVSPSTAAIVGDIAGLLIATGAAIGATGAAGYNLATAIIAEQKAQAQKLAAAQEETVAAANRVVAYTRAVGTDQKGLRP
jgi:type II secretory pathway pseudopilin PulG